MPRAHHFQQAGYAEPGITAQFHRIAVDVIHPAQQHIDPLQPIHGLHPQEAIAHHKVARLHQRKTEVTGEVGVLKVGLVLAARALAVQ